MNLASSNPFEVLAEIAASHKLTPEQWREAREAILFEGKAWDFIVSHFDNVTVSSQVRKELMARKAVVKKIPDVKELLEPSSFLGRIVPVEDLEFKLKMQDFRSGPAPKKKKTTAAPAAEAKPSLAARYKALTTRTTTPEGADDAPPPSPAARVKGARSRRGPIDDKWGKMSVDQLAEAAKAGGYEEMLAPNGGVRKMRLLNWCRHHLK